MSGPNTPTDLEASLLDAIDSTEATVRGWLDQGRVVVGNRSVLRMTAKEAPEPGPGHRFSRSVDVIQRAHLDGESPDDLEEVLGKARLAELRKAIEGKREDPFGQNLAIAHLIFSVVEPRVLGQPAPDPRQAIASWLAALDGECAPYAARSLLKGIQMHGLGGLDLGPGMRLRRPETADLEAEFRPATLLFSGHYLSGEEPTAVLDIDNAATEVGADQRSRSAIRALRLYRVGGVYSLWTSVSSSNPFAPSHASRELRLVSNANYQLLEDDAPKITAFVRDVSGSLPDPHGPARPPTEIQIAIERYEDGLLLPGRWEQHLVAAINALEALLLDETLELGYRLAARCAVILGSLGSSPAPISESIRAGYKTRSNYLHGSPTRVSGDVAARQLATAREAARAMIIIFAQASANGVKKKVILAAADSALSSCNMGNLTRLIRDNVLWLPAPVSG